MNYRSKDLVELMRFRNRTSLRRLSKEVRAAETTAARLREIFEEVCERRPGRMKALPVNERRHILPFLAGHSNTPPDVLDRLADHPDPRILEKVAARPDIPEATLERLWEEKAGSLELGLALSKNPSTPPHMLSILASREPTMGRAGYLVNMLANPATTVEVLAEILSQHPKFGVSVSEVLSTPVGVDPRAVLAVQLRDGVSDAAELLAAVDAVLSAPAPLRQNA